MAPTTGARLAGGFLTYLIAVVCLVTLAPFAFRLPAHLSLYWQASIADFVANILMFVPLGFLYRLTRRPGRDPLAARALGLGLGLSAAIEIAQLFLPTRFSAPADVLANGTGAWLGALALDRVIRYLGEHGRSVGTLALELPLMGLIYLLIPLLWLHGLAHGSTTAAALMALPLGLLGGVILAALHRYRLGPAGAARPEQISAAAGAWYALGVLPWALAHPGRAIAGTIVVSGWTLLLARAPVFNVERRFEGETLRRVIPLFVLFLLLLFLGPEETALHRWHGAMGSSALWIGSTTEGILRVLEQLAAFTVVGYLAAESRGRREIAFAAAWREVAAISAVIALAMEMVAGWQAGPGASVLRAVAGVVAAVHGGWIYHLQRDHVRGLLGGGVPFKPPVISRRPLAIGHWPEAAGRETTGNALNAAVRKPIANGSRPTAISETFHTAARASATPAG
ncbi:MAG: VanZ family protein [Gemmatimonadales bacterium]